MRLPIAVLFLASGCSTGCSTPAIALHAPAVAATPARDDGAKVELAPMTAAPNAALSFPAALERGDVAAVVSSGIANELRGRALRGGDFAVKCALDRVALRREGG